MYRPELRSLENPAMARPPVPVLVLVLAVLRVSHDIGRKAVALADLKAEF